MAGMDRAQGIDVSHHTPVYDWKAVYDAGMSFVGIKATNGVGTDPMFTRHRAGSRTQPFELTAYYHFPKPGSPPSVQAARFLATVGTLLPRDRLALDVELDPLTNWCPDVAFVDAFVRYLVDRVPDRRTIVYTSARVWKELMGSPSWPGAIATDLWVPRYAADEPALPVDGAGLPVWPKWTIWQDSESFTCPGVSAPIDHDWFNGMIDDLRTYAKLAGT
jgi:lysozyme